MTRLYIAANAWDEPAVWADHGTGEPEYVCDRDRFPAGQGGDDAWAILTAAIPEATP